MKADRPIERLCGRSSAYELASSLAVCQRSGRDTAGRALLEFETTRRRLDVEMILARVPVGSVCERVPTEDRNEKATDDK